MLLPSGPILKAKVVVKNLLLNTKKQTNGVSVLDGFGAFFFYVSSTLLVLNLQCTVLRLLCIFEAGCTSGISSTEFVEKA